MAELSFPWPDTTDPGPQVGDGRLYTSAEWDQWWEMVFSQMGGATESVLPEVWNELAVTDPDVVNKVDVDTGAAVVKGKAYWNTASNRLTVASAAGGTTRKDRAILRCDWTGGVGTQYTVRLAVKQGTQADPPTMTQTDNTVWEISLAQFVVDDAGNITGLTDERAFCHFATKVDADMLDASIAGDGLAGGAGSALSVNVDDATIEIDTDTLQVKDGGIDADALAATVAGNGLAGGAGTALSVGVDGATIEINADALRVKDGGVTIPKLSFDPATQAELDAHTVLTTAHEAVSAPTASKMMVRDAAGRAQVQDPGVAADIANQQWTNSQIATHAALTTTHGAVSAPTVNKIIIRDGSGRAQVADPSADADIANKGWVNNNLPGGNIPIGGIILWSGAIVDIPANWQLCDGTGATPDLRDRFVMGAGSTHAPDATGGTLTKNLAHTHGPGSLNTAASASVFNVQSGTDYVVSNGNHDHDVDSGVTGSGGSASQDIMPPWYALAYIQRVT